MNVIANNIIVNPGSYVSYGANAYIMKLSTNVKVDLSNNYLTRSVDAVKFTNPTGYNYRLTTGSPAIDKGRDITSYNIPKDYYSATRFKGAAYDIGASEY
jgi:hypothetical protein